MAKASGGTPKQPNIVFIMGDDIGWFNISAYHRGIMAGRTPNIDKMAAEGMLFTDYYAEASCTAGRANFTGSLMYGNWFATEFWRFVFVQQVVATAARTFIDYPPMQKGASFNMDSVKEQVQRALQAHHGQ